MSEPVETANELTAAPRRGFATYSPFRLGLTAAIGFGLAYLLFRALEHGRDTLVLLGLSLFLAAGLDPAVRRVESAGVKRAPAVAVVFVGALALLTGLCFAVVPPLVEQTTTFAHHLPGYITTLQHNRRVADLDRRFGVLNWVQNRLQSSNFIQQIAGNLLTVGTTVATTIFQVFTLAILTLYFLAYLRDITAFVYRLTPSSRRPQVSRIGDKIVTRIGQYVVGTLALALLRGSFTLVFLWVVGVPYPFALAFIAALLDLAPVVGTALAAIVVCCDRHRRDRLLRRLRGAGPAGVHPPAARSIGPDQPGRRAGRCAGRLHHARRDRLSDLDPAGRGDHADHARGGTPPAGQPLSADQP